MTKDKYISGNGNPLDSIAEKILKLSPESLQKKAALGLKMSIEMSQDMPPVVYTPKDIKDHTGLSIKMQRGLGILMTKESAYHFLRDRMGLPIEYSLSSFKRDYGERKLKDFFKKNVQKSFRKSGNALVYTIAEWLHMVEVMTQVGFPAELEHLLEK